MTTSTAAPGRGPAASALLSPSTPTRPRPSLNGTAVGLFLTALLAAAVWSTIDLRINVASILDSLSNAADFVSRMFPLDFPPAVELALLIAETLAIVVLATALAVVLSIPVALAAASTSGRTRAGRGTARSLIVLCRAVPDLVLAILFFRVFGLGALPGVLAMGLHSIGMIGKLYADAIEELDRGPVDAAEAAGATRRQVVWATVIPALMPQLIATALHRFDINLRTSVLLGYVGVGGIGLAIADALRTLDYQRGMALALVVLALCVATELLSGAVRRALMRRSGTEPARRGWVLGRRGGGAGEDTGAVGIAPPWTVDRIRRFLSIGAVAVILAASVVGADLSADRFWAGIVDLPRTLGLFLPPGTGGILPELLEQLLVTVQIALSATLLGAVIAVPVGVLAARNVVPDATVHTSARMFIVFVRGIPELIIAIVLVVITGLGAVAGTLALAIGAVGLLSKLIADSLEETDVRVQEALRASGATRVQVFCSATARQAAPSFIAHVMYLLDTNIRSATLLGVVGAGGIGFYLLNASRVVQFDVVTTIILMILAVVLVVEALSVWVRSSVR
ncbi:phosphonate ABC transporter, permease protein PhnE [Rhodococcus sp. IEGM 1408]|uniref:phosphonate ABC transporter, permease protein PhnE n=1 Tax=Rhodococcus sp. IEGM 1408 TaxID=3082220 RepID=UPI002955CD65|nr:phosphonate ABC transporter, permease protein PhnE [Rhodococcus sp. IEGM 1408]MDV8002286.1 phosphonate ABC transporter, permease protein PhnE [Rhodococcus sp. IEGM 1408]